MYVCMSLLASLSLSNHTTNRTRRMRIITLYLYVNYTVAGLVYYGLSLGGDKFGVDPFVYMALSGVMELPGSTLTIPMVDRMGRRTSNVLCFFVTAGVLLALGVIPSGKAKAEVLGYL